jgi:hypothetical protein
MNCSGMADAGFHLPGRVALSHLLSVQHCFLYGERMAIDNY